MVCVLENSPANSQCAQGTTQFFPALAHLCAGPMLLAGPPMEVSVHRLSPALAADVAAIFPSAQLQGAALHVVLTFQHAADGLDLAQAGGSVLHPPVAAEMDRLLEVFVRWQHGVRAALLAEGYWCDAINPRCADTLLAGCCVRSLTHTACWLLLLSCACVCMHLGVPSPCVSCMPCCCYSHTIHMHKRHTHTHTRTW